MIGLQFDYNELLGYTGMITQVRSIHKQTNINQRVKTEINHTQILSNKKCKFSVYIFVLKKSLDSDFRQQWIHILNMGHQGNLNL